MIGLHSRIQMEKQERQAKEGQLASLLGEQQNEMERLSAQLHSLHCAIREQQALIDDLSSK